MQNGEPLYVKTISDLFFFYFYFYFFLLFLFKVWREQL